MSEKEITEDSECEYVILESVLYVLGPHPLSNDDETYAVLELLEIRISDEDSTHYKLKMMR